MRWEMVHLRHLGLRVIALVAMSPACMYDSQARCGDDQYLDANETCVCSPGTVAIDHVCVRCPDGEVAAGAACVCPVGFLRDPATSECGPAPSGQGVDCDASNACPSTADPRCTDEGYCSRDCRSAADCVGGYACDVAMAEPVCVRPPSGLAAPCATQADCAGYEANYCETAVAHACLVSGCVIAEDDCFIGWTCCDLSSFGFTATLCVPEGQCPT